MSNPTIPVTVVSGVEGPSLYVDDHRVAGPKPWGGGSTLHHFEVRAEELIRIANNLKEKVHGPS